MSDLIIPEILAPCGSYEILIAAIKAGADACYIGGNKFGARAYATNLDSDTYKQAIEYAHLHDTRVYLTVNTLFKDNEINELYDYLLPYYEAGIDAVIVQDLGAFSTIKKSFPELKIHCSTQMNITSWQAASYMKEQGADRIVTAREMSLSEIRTIKDKVDIEIESFVHGAMCYSYSGQCLLSSYAGGRSGNRGRCAQPCRQCYNGSYLLSMKDMCTLENIPEIINSGIDSLKIEGRMKNEYYVASAVDAYKQLATDYAEGNFSLEKARELKFKLANIYNRGGFCEGYYMQHNGADMISVTRPNNQGVYMGDISGIVSGGILLELTEDLYKGDVLEISLDDGDLVEITSPVDAARKTTVRLNAPKTKFINVGTKVYRTRCNYILNSVKKELIDSADKKIITGYLNAHVGDRISFALNQNVSGEVVSAIVYGDIVDASKKNSPDTETVIKKLSQVGDTEYIFDNIYVEADDNAFIPMGVLKKLRREAISMLEQALINKYRKNTRRLSKLPYKNFNEVANRKIINNHILLKVGVISIRQIEVLCEALDMTELTNCKLTIDGIYVGTALFEKIIHNPILDMVKMHNIKIYIELPYVVRNDFDLDLYFDSILLNNQSVAREVNNIIAGFYIRNIDGYVAIKRSKFYDYIQNDKLELVIGNSLYAMNNQAIDFIGNYTYENPHELSLAEIQELYKYDGGRKEYVLYEYQQVMLSAQCIQKTTGGCNKDFTDNVNIDKITDTKSNTFYSRPVCEECVNIIYNGVPFSMLDKLEELMTMDLWDTYRINFTIEPAELESSILKAVLNYNNTGIVSMPENVYTTGHNYRGVE